MEITADRANAIVAEEIAVSGVDFGSEAPIVVNGELGDGNAWEPAKLDSETSLREQVRAWIEACRADR